MDARDSSSKALSRLASGSGSVGKDMLILMLCRESNASADALSQLLRDPSTSAGVNYEDENCKTPLFEATARGHVHLLPLLIASGSELDNVANILTNGKTESCCALHLAIASGQLDAVKLLVQSGASLHVLDHLGRSPWSLALTEKSVRDIDYAHIFTDAPPADAHVAISAYIRSVSDLLEICKSSAPSLEEAEACLLEHSELSRPRLTFQSDKGFTPLHEASSRGHNAIVDFLLQQKADVNAATFLQKSRDGQGDSKETPLHLATANGHSRVVALLIRAGANIGAITANGNSALHVSVGTFGAHRVDAAKVIVDEIISMSKVRSNLSVVSSIINCTDALKCSPLHLAAKEGALAIVKLLLSVKTVDVSGMNLSGQNPLHLASTFGHGLIVRAIAKCRESDVNKRSQTKAQDSCLHMAARRRYVNVLIELGAAGAQLVSEVKDAAGKIKSLQLICNDDSERLNVFDVAQSDEARTFVEMAFDLFRLCRREPVSSGRSIKSILADPHTRRSFLGFRTTSNNTPLHIAAMSQNIEAITDILGCYGKLADGLSSLYYGYGVDCHVTNGDGLSPLELMEKMDSVKIKSILSSSRFNMELFDIIHRRDEVTIDEVIPEIARNPASLSFKYRTARGLEHVVRELISGGGNVNTKNCKGQTPLYMAMAFLGESGNSDASTHPSDSVDARLARIAALLIDAGATVDDKDEDAEYWGETALFRAARMCRHECIKVLLSAGADVNVLSKNGDTIFHFYRKNAHLTMQLILESGLKNINAVDNLEGNTALHAAVKRSVTGLSVALLLNAKADPSIPNKEGLSPLHLACRFDRIKSIQRLLEHGVDVNIITGPTLKAVIVERSQAQSNAQQSSSSPAWDSSSLDWEQFHDVKQRLESALSLVENERDKSNAYETPLHLACRYSNGEAVCALLKSKRPPNTLAQNANGNIPLEVSFRLDAPTTRLLLEMMSRQSTDIQRLSLCNTGGRDFTNFEDNLAFIFSKFPKLQQLSIEDCDGLRSLPPSVSKLNSLNSIRLVSCNCLRSLPDEIGTMTQLQNIKIENCQALEFPPAKICEGNKSTQRIQFYLKESAGATPLRSVKVLLLGNGRSGKTSVLRMLAGMPLESGDAGPESTRGVSVNPLSEKLKPGLKSKMLHDVPNLAYWDFAGQLEYSAAHEYFMSNRQAVYVIIFSVMEERLCMLQQVKYWLNTVSLRCSSFNRLLLVGTKIDLVSEDVDEYLARLRADMLALVRRCCNEIVRQSFTDKDVMFVSSLKDSKAERHKDPRRSLKDRLYELSKGIFVGNVEYLRSLRFPEQYKDMLRTVEYLEQRFPDVPPIYHTWDTKGCGLGTKEIAGVKELKALDGILSQQKKDALQVLHDTGHIFIAECEQGTCVCFKPQFIADIIAIFADPSCSEFDRTALRACASQEAILRLLRENLKGKYSGSHHMSSIFNFLLHIRIIIQIELVDTLTVLPSASLLQRNLFMVPSALKGRPSFWREVLPRPVMCLRGLRFSSMQKIVTVGQFLRVMSSRVHNPDRMWGCAFVIEVTPESSSAADLASDQFKGEVPQSTWVFVRLYETRDFVDAVVLGSSISDINSPKTCEVVNKLMKNMDCDLSSPLMLCPFCCASDVYVRCGAAHKFFPEKHKKQNPLGDAEVCFDEHASAASPVATQDLSSASVAVLNCSRFHSVSFKNIRFGLMLDGLGRNEMPPLYPEAWVSRMQRRAASSIDVDDSESIALPRRSKSSPASAAEPAPSTNTESKSSALSSSSPSRVRDRLPWQQVTSAGFTVMPDLSGRALCQSFFVSTLQLSVNDVVSRHSMKSLHSAIDAAAADSSMSDHVHETKVLRSSQAAAAAAAPGDSTFDAAKVACDELVHLKLIYRVGDMIGKKTISHVYACSRSNTVVVNAASVPPSTKSVLSSSSSATSTTFVLEHSHSFSEGDAVMLCVTKDCDGHKRPGISCKISCVVDDHTIELTRAEPLPAGASQKLPVVNGSVLLPQVASFGPLDWVLVMYMEQGFSIMAGKSDCLQVLSLTHGRCVAHEDEAACWREVDDNWSIMLGEDSKHYEITGVTLFRNVERERMFLQEVDAMACAAKDVSVEGSAAMYEASPLKRQVMGHFKEFSQKFSLLPSSENQGVNLSAAWWGKSPAAYHTTALRGFWNLPSHMKLDPGYFGEGFYLTRYPRYSDYYLNGLSMSKRIIEKGDILMCYTALGRPYPVTEDPSKPSSLLGEPCSPDSPCHNQGSNAHDSHYVTVKLHPEKKQFYPCPERQVPDFDEIVVFNPKRILPVAYVSFQRRRKTLLWLACAEEEAQVKSILSRINVVEDVDRATVGKTMTFQGQDTLAKLEDQVDVTLFVSVTRFVQFMLANTHFKDYPSSLFRIVCAHQQYSAPGSLFDVLQSHPTWSAYAPEVLVLAPTLAHVQANVLQRNVRVATDAKHCFEFASFVD